jgi:hypothetical protein
MDYQTEEPKGDFWKLGLIALVVLVLIGVWWYQSQPVPAPDWHPPMAGHDDSAADTVFLRFKHVVSAADTTILRFKYVVFE